MRSGSDDEKTLASLRFEIGDYLDIAVCVNTLQNKAFNANNNNNQQQQQKNNNQQQNGQYQQNLNQPYNHSKQFVNQQQRH